MEKGFIWIVSLRVYSPPWQGRDCVRSPWETWKQEIAHIWDGEVSRKGNRVHLKPKDHLTIQFLKLCLNPKRFQKPLQTVTPNEDQMFNLMWVCGENFHPNHDLPFQLWHSRERWLGKLDRELEKILNHFSFVLSRIYIWWV